MHTKKKKIKMGQERGKDGEGEGKGWRRRGNQGEEGGNPALASTTALGNVAHHKQSVEKPPAAGKVVIHLGLQLV